MRGALRKISRKVLGDDLFASFRGLYWSIKLRLTEYEPETQALRLLVSRNGICLDVGGNFGQFASFLARAVGPGGKVYSFEPLAYNRRVFVTVIRHMGLSNVELFPYALGNKSGWGTISAPELNTAEAYLTSGEAGPAVEMTTVDSWAESVGLAGVDFIKIDVEGFEFFVLQGAQRILRIHKPAVLCEVTDVSRERYGSSTQDVFDLLHDIGYHSYVWQNQNLVPCSAQLSGVNNYFFLHPSRPYFVEDLRTPGPSAGGRS